MECQAAAVTALSAALIQILIGKLLRFAEEELKKRRSRRVWVKPWLLKKKQELSHVNLIRKLQDIPEDSKNYLRVDKENYLDLLERID